MKKIENLKLKINWWNWKLYLGLSILIHNNMLFLNDIFDFAFFELFVPSVAEVRSGRGKMRLDDWLAIKHEKRKISLLTYHFWFSLFISLVVLKLQFEHLRHSTFQFQFNVNMPSVHSTFKGVFVLAILSFAFPNHAAFSIFDKWLSNRFLLDQKLCRRPSLTASAPSNEVSSASLAPFIALKHSL